MPNSIKVGVITHPQGAHLDAYFAALANTEEAEAVALADSTGGTLPLAQKALKIKLKDIYKDAAKMLAEFQPHMVLISMEAALAPPMIDAALEAGCHVFAEKPACVRVHDFEPLVLKSQQKHRHLMLALANRVHPAVQQARRLIKEGMLGKVYATEVHFTADQTRLKSEEQRKSWFSIKARAGGGHFLWLGIHWLDLLLYITGLKVKQVAGFAGIVGGQPIDVEDSAAVALQFDNGTFGTMLSGYYLDGGKQSFIHIWGEYGWLRLGELDAPLEWYSTKSNPKLQRFQAPKGVYGYPAIVRAAVRASAGLEPAPMDAEECLHVLKTIFTFYRAAETGQRQMV